MSSTPIYCRNCKLETQLNTLCLHCGLDQRVQVGAPPPAAPPIQARPPVQNPPVYSAPPRQPWYAQPQPMPSQPMRPQPVQMRMQSAPVRPTPKKGSGLYWLYAFLAVVGIRMLWAGASSDSHKPSAVGLTSAPSVSQRGPVSVPISGPVMPYTSNAIATNRQAKQTLFQNAVRDPRESEPKRIDYSPDGMSDEQIARLAAHDKDNKPFLKPYPNQVPGDVSYDDSQTVQSYYRTQESENVQWERNPTVTHTRFSTGRKKSSGKSRSSSKGGRSHYSKKWGR